MKRIGIICEYNPFHNGHLYHINQIKKLYPECIIILILGGNFLERGDVSIIDKWKKTDIALTYGVDLVVELPFPFATQSADLFAHGSISLLNALQIDTLVFGSETNDIDSLKQLADIQLHHPAYQSIIKENLDKGDNYPTALSKALFQITKKEINTPNDILGLSYIREIMASKKAIEPICIKRTNDYHSKQMNGPIASATSIRLALKKKEDISAYVPEQVIPYLNTTLHFIQDYFTILKYKIMTTPCLELFQTVDEGFESRIKKHIVAATNYDDFIKAIKTKRYTFNRINRMMIHILCNFTKEEAKEMTEVSYIRILGFTDKGQTYLNKIKKECPLPILTKFRSNQYPMLDLEYRANCTYASILPVEEQRSCIESEYKTKPIRKK